MPRLSTYRQAGHEPQPTPVLSRSAEVSVLLIRILPRSNDSGVISKLGS